ncbi:MAG TPA: AAA family ATPase, partial [Longimicrobiaceae bacterium]|nr:AAA family ATPase [Longimicrobiaceae bacterium]
MSGLRFRALAVRRMPGIHDGGFELADLAAGLNIVFGPNASGKTTTSRALEAAIWPPTVAPEAAWIEATFELDGDLWSVELDARRARLQRAGNPAGS